MPTYVYKCITCDEEFEVVQGLNDIRCTDCPKCYQVTNYVIPQMFGMADLTPNTLGSLADYNRKHMSTAHYNEAVQKMANDRKELTAYAGKIPEGGTIKDRSDFKEMPWAKDTLPVEKINKMTGDQKKDYVLQGKVPIGLG